MNDTRTNTERARDIASDVVAFIGMVGFIAAFAGSVIGFTG
jgi:hypothetical protein